MKTASRSRVGALLLVASFGLGACKNSYDQRVGANLDAMLAAIKPCPPPAACSQKRTASGREVQVCAPDLEPQALGVGDIVITQEMKGHEMLGRVVSHNGANFEIQFPDDSKFERAPDRIIGRVCR